MEGVRLAVAEDEKRAISSDNRISERPKCSGIFTFSYKLHNQDYPVAPSTVGTLWQSASDDSTLCMRGEM